MKINKLVARLDGNYLITFKKNLMQEENRLRVEENRVNIFVRAGWTLRAGRHLEWT